jgi:hypothetical protein
MNNDCDWWNISGIAPFLRAKAIERDKQKLGYESGRFWTDDSTSFVGFCGEACVFFETGLPMDLSLRYDGDKGVDGKLNGVTYDVKVHNTTRSIPALLENKHSVLKPKADIFILCLRLNNQVKVIGWATKEQLFSTPLVTYGKNGEKHRLTQADLEKMGQIGLPPTLKRRSPEDLEKVRQWLDKKRKEVHNLAV